MSDEMPDVNTSLRNAIDHIQHESYNDALSSILEAAEKHEADLAAKQVELLRGILEEYKDDHINGNQDKKYSSIIQAKINKLEGK